jgi:hypothetical protein
VSRRAGSTDRVPDQQLDLQQQPGIGIVEAHAGYLFRPPDPVAQCVRVDVQVGGGIWSASWVGALRVRWISRAAIAAAPCSTDWLSGSSGWKPSWIQIDSPGLRSRSRPRANSDYEIQMLYGIRDAEQSRLISEGVQVRTYIPFGHDWYGYFMRRLAERPANLTFFLRSLVSRC